MHRVAKAEQQRLGGRVGTGSEIECTVTVCSDMLRTSNSIQPAYWYSQLVGNAH